LENAERLKILVLALVALVGLSCSQAAPARVAVRPWPIYRGDLARDGHPPGAVLSAAEASRLTPLWRVRLSGAVDGSAIVTGSDVYVGSQGGDLADVAAQTGAVRWKRAGLGAITGSPAVDSDAIYASTLTGHVRAFAASDGTLLWDWTAPGQQPAIWSSPVPFNGTVLVGIASQAGDTPLESGRIIALSGGHQVWELCVEAGCRPGGGIWSTPAIDANGRAFVGVGNPDDGVLAFDAATGTRLWETTFYADGDRDLDVGATPVILDFNGKEAVAIGSVGGVFKLLDAATGRELWSSELVQGSAVHGLIASAAFDATNLYVPSASPPNGIFALKPADGSVRWSFKTALPVYSAAADGSHVLVFGEGNVFGDTGVGQITALDATNGNLLWRYDTHSAVHSGPVIAGNLIVVGDSAGDVLAFAPSS
jgi:outer membrane protein assembly factor BamB